MYFCTSLDGVHWSHPVRLLASPHDISYRTRDYPVDGDGLGLVSLQLSPSAAADDDDASEAGGGGGGGEAVLCLTLQHRLDLRVEQVGDPLHIGPT